MVSCALLSSDASACCLRLSPIIYTGSANSPSTSGAPLSHIANSDLLSIVFSLFSLLITSGGPLFAISVHLLSLVIGSGLLSAILGCLLLIVLGYSLSLSASDSPLLAISGGVLLFPMPHAYSCSLFLTNIPSCVRHSFLPYLPLFCSFLPSLLILFARNPAPLTGKRLFDQVFITQKPITSTQR